MTEKKNSTNEIKEGKTCAILAYLLVGIIWYFADDSLRKNSFVNFHVKQGLVLLGISIAGNIVLTLSLVFAWLIPLWGLVMLALLVIGIINVSNGDKKELPIIGQFGKKLKF